MKSENNEPTLIIIRGLPGSGKSYIANELSKTDLKAPIVILDPDSIDINSREYLEYKEKLIQNDVDSKLHPYRFLRNSAYETILKKGTIIWTQAFTNQDMLDRTIKNLKLYASDNNLGLRVLIVEVDTEIETARQRVKIREEQGLHGVDEENFARFVREYSSFGGYEYSLVKVNGSDSVKISISNILQKLSKV